MRKKKEITTKDVKVKYEIRPKSGGVITSSSTVVQDHAKRKQKSPERKDVKVKPIVSGPDLKIPDFDYEKMKARAAERKNKK